MPTVWVHCLFPLAFALLLGVGCSSTPQRLDPKINHKKDLSFCIKDVGCYSGTGVVPRMDQYALEVAPRKAENVDRVVFATCHRTMPFLAEEMPDSDLPFFKKVFGQKKKGKNWVYLPTPGIEDTGDCDLYVYAIDLNSEDHAWGVMRTENPQYTLPAKLFCNGDGGKEFNGVSACDAKAGTFQQVKFNVPVKIKTKPASCPVPKRYPGGHYKWPVSKGKCAYLIQSEDKRKHSMLIFGWESFKFKKG